MNAIRLVGITPDDRYLLRVDVPLSPLWVKALASATEVLESRHPTLPGPEILARVIAAGCCAIQDEERRKAKAAIKAFKQAINERTTTHEEIMKNPITLPELAAGETYVGAIGDQSGNLHHVILLPGDNDDAIWATQKEWAASIGGALPTRIEQAMLWQNCRDQFQADWYWSGEAHASAGYAWCQSFGSGYQSYDGTDYELRARAVRRLPI